MGQFEKCRGSEEVHEGQDSTGERFVVVVDVADVAATTVTVVVVADSYN